MKPRWLQSMALPNIPQVQHKCIFVNFEAALCADLIWNDFFPFRNSGVTMKVRYMNGDLFWIPLLFSVQDERNQYRATERERHMTDDDIFIKSNKGAWTLPWRKQWSQISHRFYLCRRNGRIICSAGTSTNSTMCWYAFRDNLFIIVPIGRPDPQRSAHSIWTQTLSCVHRLHRRSFGMCRLMAEHNFLLNLADCDFGFVFLLKQYAMLMMTTGWCANLPSIWNRISYDVFSFFLQTVKCMNNCEWMCIWKV